MVAEARAARLDLDSRVNFTKEKDPIRESRAEIEDLCGVEEDLDTRVARSANLLYNAALLGDVEVG